MSNDEQLTPKPADDANASPERIYTGIDGMIRCWELTIEHYARLGRDITKEPFRKDIFRILRGPEGREHSM